MKRVLWLGICLSLVFSAWSSFTLAYTSPGAPSGRVNDFAGVLTSAQKQGLESVIQNFEQETSNQLAVVTIQNLGGDTIENYANELFREWGIGDKEKNNGLLFLIAIEDRKMRIEVGYGLEGAVTDIATKHIQDEIVRPAFQSGDYWLGIAGGTQALINLAGGSAELVSNQDRSSSSDMPFLPIFSLFLLYTIIALVMMVLKLGHKWQRVTFGISGTVFSFLFWLFGQVDAGTLAWLIFIVLIFTAGKRGKGFGGVFPRGRFTIGGGGGGFGGGSSGGGGSSSSW